MKSINLDSKVARQIIRQEYGNSTNFITPNKVGYAAISRGTLYCEISSGRGMAGNPIYGITVVEKRKDGSTIRRTELSKKVNSLAQVYSELEFMQEIYR